MSRLHPMAGKTCAVGDWRRSYQGRMFAPLPEPVDAIAPDDNTTDSAGWFWFLPSGQGGAGRGFPPFSPQQSASPDTMRSADDA